MSQRVLVEDESRGLGDVYKRQVQNWATYSLSC